MSPEGHYIEATPVKNAIILNVGDLLQLWRNYTLKSTLHRVIVSSETVIEKRAKQSIACFTNSDNTYVIKYEEPDGIVCQKSVQEHMDQRNRASIFNNRKSSIQH